MKCKSFNYTQNIENECGQWNLLQYKKLITGEISRSEARKRENDPSKYKEIDRTIRHEIA